MWEIAPIAKSLSQNKTGPLLLALQLAITMAILSNSLYYMRERVTKILRPTGFASSEISSMYMKGVDRAFDLTTILARDKRLIRGLSGVVSVSVFDYVPLTYNTSKDTVTSLRPLYQQHYKNLGNEVEITLFQTDHEFIETLGLSLLEGRKFNIDDVRFHSSDTEGFASVIIISQALAKTLFPGRSAIGKTVYLKGAQAVRVVGVVNDLLGSWADLPKAHNVAFLPMIAKTGPIYFLVRTETDQQTMTRNIRSKLLAIDDQRTIERVRSFEFLINRSYGRDIAMVKILSTIMILLVLVNSFGVVGLTIFLINQRSKYIGIRRALGATRLEILRYFLMENAIICIVASLTGSLLALLCNLYLASRFSLGVLPWYYLPITAAILLVITLLAAWYPVSRAATISPAVANRGARQ